jgi:hypothetical protein
MIVSSGRALPLHNSVAKTGLRHVARYERNRSFTMASSLQSHICSAKYAKFIHNSTNLSLQSHHKTPALNRILPIIASYPISHSATTRRCCLVTTKMRWKGESSRFLSTGTYTADDRERIKAVACESQTPVSLQTLLRTGRGDFLHKSFAESTVEKQAATELVLRQVASFLRRELPVRMARRVADLESIPVLRDMNSVLQVKDAYIQSCMDILNYPREIDSPAAEEEFSRLIENIYERHGSVLVQMARGAYEFRQAIRSDKGSTDIELEEETHLFLDRFYLCRIGIRVLIGQYLALRQPPVPNFIGIICSQTSPYEVVKRAIDDAAFMCTRKYGDAPEVIITGRLDLTFPYVPTHLRKYIQLLLH